MTWPRSVARAATALAIFPAPIIAIRMASAEKLLVQSAHHIGTVLFSYHECHIDRRGTLRDDLDVRRPHGVEYAGGEPWGVAQSDTHDGHNSPVFLNPYLTQVTEILQQRVQAR